MKIIASDIDWHENHIKENPGEVTDEFHKGFTTGLEQAREMIFVYFQEMKEHVEDFEAAHMERS